MHFTLSEIDLQKQVIALGATESQLCCVDHELTLHLFDKNRYYTLSSSVPLLLEPDAHEGYSKKKIALSKKGDIALVDSKSFEIHIINKLSKHPRDRSLSLHRIDITALCYSPSGRCLASCDGGGNIFITHEHEIEAIFKTQKPITEITFSQNERFISAVEPFGKIYIFDLFSHELFFEMDCGVSSTIKKVLHADGDRVVAFFESGDVVEIELISKEAKSYKIGLDRVEALEGIEDGVLVLNLDECHVASLSQGCYKIERVTEFPYISSFMMDGRFLVCVKSGTMVSVIDAEKYKKESELNMEVKNYQKVLEYFQKNSFLMIFPSIKDGMERGWKNELQSAVELLREDNILRAHKICAPFLIDAQKKELFNEFKNFTKELKQFYKEIKDKNTKEAHRLLQMYPFLRYSKKSQELEKHWEYVFSAVKKLLFQKTENFPTLCKKALAPFAEDETKRELIESLLLNPEIFIKAEVAIKHNNFKLFYALAEKYPYLKKGPLFKNANLYGNMRLQEAKSAYLKKEYKKASDILSELLGFSNLKFDVLSFYDHIRLLGQMLDAISSKDVKEIFRIIGQDVKLFDFQEFEATKEQVNEMLFRASQRAIGGDPAGTIKELKELMEVPFFLHRCAFVIKQAYVKEFANAKEKHVYADWESTILLYLERFGVDYFLIGFLESSRALGVLSSLKSMSEPFGYLRMPYLDSLIVSTKKMER